MTVEERCFEAHGEDWEVQLAWEAALLIARYRVSQRLLSAIYAFTLVPVSRAFRRTQRYQTR